MATFFEYEDELKTCPYNRCHKVAARRFQQHVAKCAKQSQVTLKECPFNSTHRVPFEEYQAHVDSCPDSRVIIREMLQKAEYERIKEEKQEKEEKDKKVEIFKRQTMEEEEDEWSRGNGKRYVIPALADQEKKAFAQEKPGFIDPMVIQRMAPAERRKHHQRQVELHKEIMEKRNAHERATAASSPMAQEEHACTLATAERVKDEEKPKIRVAENVLREPRVSPGFGGVGRGKRPSVS